MEQKLQMRSKIYFQSISSQGRWKSTPATREESLQVPLKMYKTSYNVGPPNLISWFITPAVTMAIGTVNFSYCSYKPTKRYL